MVSNRLRWRRFGVGALLVAVGAVLGSVATIMVGSLPQGLEGSSDAVPAVCSEYDSGLVVAVTATNGREGYSCQEQVLAAKAAASEGSGQGGAAVVVVYDERGQIIGEYRAG